MKLEVVEGREPSYSGAGNVDANSQHTEQRGGFSSKKGMKLGHSREKRNSTLIKELNRRPLIQIS